MKILIHRNIADSI